MENEEKLIGSRIKSLRKENKMSQEELEIGRAHV